MKTVNTRLFLYYPLKSDQPRGLVVKLLTASHEVPGSIPGSAVGIFPCREDSHSDHALGRL
jgi:hypothetical protein